MCLTPGTRACGDAGEMARSQAGQGGPCGPVGSAGPGGVCDPGRAVPAQDGGGGWGCWCPLRDRGTATLLDMACNCSFRSRSSFRRLSFSVLSVCSWASWKSTWRCKDAMAPA